MGTIEFSDGVYGVKAAITSMWSPTMLGELVNANIAELELNHGNGWCGSDLAFLSRLPQLLAFSILDMRIESVEPIHVLHSLKKLGVLTYCKSEIRFSEFPELETCSLEWREKASSLFDCVSLKKLFLDNYTGKDALKLGQLTKLKSLDLLSASVENIEGLRTLKSLYYLRLGNLKRLTSLRGLEALTELEELVINRCRLIKSIGEISKLHKLRRLGLPDCGGIASLQPLCALSELKAVWFYGSTKILDGDLRPLLDMQLERVSFMNRRHYSHAREEFGEAWSSPCPDFNRRE
ncbi:leucine-rich repeat domain-containing protein [Schlesneria paludicola]|uniref:hypothetical protein n=1 Tax=Schlesneria paludicola TaxID=360056 RepID=UPI00029AEB90|nr:hypothetical protein [Schlesneria paludicola]